MTAKDLQRNRCGYQGPDEASVSSSAPWKASESGGRYITYAATSAPAPIDPFTLRPSAPTLQSTPFFLYPSTQNYVQFCEDLEHCDGINQLVISALLDCVCEDVNVQNRLVLAKSVRVDLIEKVRMFDTRKPGMPPDLRGLCYICPEAGHCVLLHTSTWKWLSLTKWSKSLTRDQIPFEEA